MKPLAFKLVVRRDVVGSHIDITVNSEPDRLIARVTTTLDNIGLGDDRLKNQSTHFERGFAQVGNAGPGTKHVLEVQAYDEGGSAESATKIWVDDI
jgi:hypothetical protein